MQPAFWLLLICLPVLLQVSHYSQQVTGMPHQQSLTVGHQFLYLQVKNQFKENFSIIVVQI